MKKIYLAPEIIIRQVNIHLMQDGVSIVDKPNPGNPGWTQMESRENDMWENHGSDVWED